ncbi:hypothetical protein ES332_A03G021500v1 [Gossypium tomentosum]|uniref:Copper amine oxidase N2-terminal domain-containing protein n=1 Tax=Gossypium tomentosum TaxID=34277 RepID=A0A5D2R161_GOSTO|nr:hypothetical protein ES332_A03G021500v1 [Gossypium tomentosum]
MEKSSCIHFCFISCLVLFIVVGSWYRSTNSSLPNSSLQTPWSTSKNRIFSNSKASSVLETQAQTSIDHSAEAPHHPLDPLTVQEINKVQTILSSYEPFSFTFPTIHTVLLDEPDKVQVLKWRKGDALLIGIRTS